CDVAAGIGNVGANEQGAAIGSLQKSARSTVGIGDPACAVEGQRAGGVGVDRAAVDDRQTTAVADGPSALDRIVDIGQSVPVDGATGQVDGAAAAQGDVGDVQAAAAGAG